MRKTSTLLAGLCAGLLLSPGATLRAQSLDPAFQPTILKGPMTQPPQSGVSTLAVQPDGKILAAGGFDFVNGALTGKLQRFNPDGTVDATFNAGTGANGFITAVLVQPDGKILVAGGFNLFNGAAGANLVRLHANGSRDATFSTLGAGLTRLPLALALQADGKILAGGEPFDLNGPTNPGLIRLNANGTRDTGFNPGTGADRNIVFALLVQPDGKILVGGSFGTFNGQNTGSLTRLNDDGSIDASFSVGGTQNFSGTVRALLRQPSGKLLVGGLFYANSVSTRLLRLLPGGTPDNTFTASTGTTSGTITSMLPQSSGAVVVAGTFTQYHGVARGRVARISADGLLDPTFTPTTGADNTVQALAETSTGQVLIGGLFGQYNNTAQPALGRLSASGSLDASFAPLLESRGTVQQAFALSSGQMLVGGSLSAFNGTALTGLPTLPRRLNADGSLDPGYAAAAAGPVQAVLPTGSAYLLDNQGSLRRLQPGGALDNGFATRPLGGRFGPTGGSFGSAYLLGATAQPDGKVLAYGVFTAYDGAVRNGLVRLLPDGSLDASFTPPASAALPVTTGDIRRVSAVYVLPSGKIVYQWAPQQFTGQTYLTCLNADGSLDATFSIGTGPANAAGAVTVYNVLPVAGDKLLIWSTNSAYFTSINGQPAPYGFTRLTTTGAVDPTFSGLSAFYWPRYMQADGKILATTGNSALTLAGSQLVRLHPDGSLDTSFAPVDVPSSIFSVDDQLLGVTQQPADGKLVLYGSFRYVAGQPRIGLARLTNGTLATKTGQTIQPLTLYPNPAQQQVTVQLPAGAEQLRVLDLRGRLVQQRQLPARQPEAALDLAGMPAGLYLVQVAGAAGLYQQRVVVTP